MQNKSSDVRSWRYFFPKQKNTTFRSLDNRALFSTAQEHLGNTWTSLSTVWKRVIASCLPDPSPPIGPGMELTYFQHSLQFVSATRPCLLWRAEEKNVFLSLLGLDLTTWVCPPYASFPLHLAATQLRPRLREIP